MMRAERSEWLRPSLTLIGCWAAATLGWVALLSLSGVNPGRFLSRVTPFLLAGYLAGYLVPVSSRKPRIIAAALLVVVSALAWTGFAIASENIGAATMMSLFVASLPVMCVAALWAYAAMAIGGRRHERTSSSQAHELDPEIDEIEAELRREISSDAAL